YMQDTGVFIVCLSVLNKEGCADSVCKYVEVTSNHGIFIPNVFTPQNGDNKNDVFDIPIFGHEYYALAIYNRWGQLVFESNDDTNDWNGKEFNTNKDCSDGVYFFVLSYRFKGDKTQLRTGTVTLIRVE
ncbi:MAG: gliding motility-associated C-terminal domain-containing protein, partial [Bacteroidia bacterium]|nr:gliding motility-associated C-terminal domain-containing protein [Bacteroidia bacterium]